MPFSGISRLFISQHFCVDNENLKIYTSKCSAHKQVAHVCVCVCIRVGNHQGID